MCVSPQNTVCEKSTNSGIFTRWTFCDCASLAAITINLNTKRY